MNWVYDVSFILVVLMAGYERIIKKNTLNAIYNMLIAIIIVILWR